MEGLVDQHYACKLMHEYGIELPKDDKRTAAEYVTEMFVYIEAVKTEEQRDRRRLNEERYRSAQSQTPYFA